MLRRRVLLVAVAAAVPASGQVCTAAGNYALKGDQCGGAAGSVCVNEAPPRGAERDWWLRPSSRSADGLACRSGRCQQRLAAGAACLANADCESLLCLADDPNAHGGVGAKAPSSVCYGTWALGGGQQCPATGVVSSVVPNTDILHTLCGNGRCWPDASAPVATRSLFCREHGVVGEPCGVLWQRTGSAWAPVADSCEVDGGSSAAFVPPTSYCKPDFPSWRPADSAATVRELTARGRCTEIPEVDEGAPCAVIAGTTVRPNCRWGHFCKVRPGVEVCSELLEEGDSCQSGDVCEYGHMCDLATERCVELFTVKPNQAAAHPWLCELSEDDLPVVVEVTVNTSVAATPRDARCRLLTQSCTADSECSNARWESAVPLFCDTTTNRCASVTKHACRDEFYDWARWRLGREHSRFSLRVRRKSDEDVEDDLACCIWREAGGCIAREDARAGARVVALPRETGGSSAASLPALLPGFMTGSGVSVLELSTDAQGAAMCKSSGTDVAMIAVVSCLCALCVCVCCIVCVREYALCWSCGCVSSKPYGPIRFCAGPDPSEPVEQPDSEPSVKAEARAVPREAPEQQPVKAPVRAEEAAQPQEPASLPQHTTPQQPQQSPAAPRSLGPEMVSKSVDVYYGGEDGYQGWYPAKVLSYDPPGTFSVVFDADGALCEGVMPESMRVSAASPKG